MRGKLIALLMLTTMFCFAQKKVVICDNEDNEPIPGAAVIAGNGLILGTTDKDGAITALKKDFPISVRCLGYEANTIDGYIDTIRLIPATYTLKEAVISAKERPITRVVTYMREYTTGAVDGDTMQLYCEHMLQYFFAEGKVKGFHQYITPTTLKTRRYGRIAKKNKPDSVFMPGRDDDISSISFYDMITGVPFRQIQESESLQNGASTDTVMGKYSPKYSYTKTKDKFIYEEDWLADKKNHMSSPFIFKLFGFTIDITEWNSNILFNINESGKYGIYDYVYNTGHFKAKGKGKLLRWICGVKDYIGIDCYVEQYPVTIERITVDEYKELDNWKTRPKTDIQLPEIVQPLPPAILQLIERARTI